ncbi:hypothetical protein TNCT_11191 [Trichonephila clavata]|uniref:Uncharacterized protein n=1 Tax=Trichonephila clavata TaxID=2740835 RepID=A0A8X6HIX1_TRICU|nr:hypothetical protein TNCT_11191 [Trichonephila clavata]
MFINQRKRERELFFITEKLLANPTPTQTKTQSAQTTSSSTQTRPENSVSKALPTPEPSAKSSKEIFSTLTQLKDPEVREMFEVLSQFVNISKSNRSRAEKFSELSSLLDLPF